MNEAVEPADRDAEDLARAARGDRSAFGRLFDRLGGGAFGYAKRLLTDGAAAEDAVHDAFLKLFDVARRGTFEPARGTVRALLFRIVRSACADWRRARGREAGAPDESAAGTASDVGAADLRGDVETVLAGLPESQRSAFVLRVDSGLSYDEIASALGASLPQVKTWIFRARRAVADRLGEPAARPGDRDGV